MSTMSIMRYFITLAAVLFIFNLVTFAAEAAQQQVFHFVGVSDVETTGDAGGFFGMSDICAEQFGAARICSTLEAVFTIRPPTFVGSAWVESSELTNHCGPRLTPWTFGLISDKGKSITPSGSITSVTCDVSQPVACCGWALLID